MGTNDSLASPTTMSMFLMLFLAKASSDILAIVHVRLRLNRVVSLV